MDFIDKAHSYYIGLQCEICDSEIERGQAIRVDEYGEVRDDVRVYVVRCRHAWCHDAVEQAARRAMVYAAQLARSCGSHHAADLIHEHARRHADEVAA